MMQSLSTLKRVAKLIHGESVSTAVLLKICAALQCDIFDIMEIVPDGSLTSEEVVRERM